MAWVKASYSRTKEKIDNQQQPTIYSTGNSTQYSVITSMEKESEKEYMHMYNWITVVHLKLTQYLEAIILHSYKIKIKFKNKIEWNIKNEESCSPR